MNRRDIHRPRHSSTFPTPLALSLRILVISMALIGVILGSACTMEPFNGDTFSGSNEGRTIAFEGFATVAGALVTVDVLDPPEQDPHAAASTWRTLAHTTADSTALYWGSDQPLYEWDADVTVVANAPDQYLWPESGLTRLRVQQNGETMISFDDADCIGQNLFEPAETIAVACASHDSGVLTLVDTDFIHSPDGDFISRKQTPLSEASQYYREIDAGPQQERFTLGGWKRVNGFEPGTYAHTLDSISGGPNDPGPTIAPPSISSPLRADFRSPEPGLSTELHTRYGAILERTLRTASLSSEAREAALQAVGRFLERRSIAEVTPPHGSSNPRPAATADPQARTKAQVSPAGTVDSSHPSYLPPLLEEVSAIYRNAADLGFGREMHCRQKEDGGAACYVTNYGDVETPVHASLDDAIHHRNPVATVAMEYVPNASGNKIRFYVYDGFGQRLEEAELDSEGVKPVPGVCLACHQGSYDEQTNKIRGARFLPFDIDSFEYTTEAGYSKSEQEESFRRLNRIVRETNATDAMADLIEGWYSDGGLYSAGTRFDGDYIPPGWDGQSTLYEQVVKPYCRMCHIAKGPGSNLDFLSFQGFEANAALIELDVCATRTMPQAEVTYYDFWKSSARAHLVGALSLPTSCATD